MNFQPDYRHMLDVLANRRPARLPVYEHIISPVIMEKILGIRFADLIHRAGKPFLWHSCGNIFSIMEDVIPLGIDAKHSNEDIIAPFDRWIELYGDRIGLLGGVDVDLLCQKAPAEIVERVADMGRRFREKSRGYALGSGNSIPDYIPVEGYLAMLEAARHLRQQEA